MRTKGGFLAILLTLFVYITSGEDVIHPKVTYISFTPPPSADISFPIHNINDRVKLNSSYSDDSPLYSVPLKQVFPYFGKYVDQIYVSPNGFVQMTPNPECGAIYCDPCRTKYYGVISGIVSDLAPYQYNKSSVSTIQSNTSTIFFFDQVPIFNNASIKFSFNIALLNEGTVFISYQSTPTPIYRQSLCSWFSGLVAPKNYTTSSIVTPEQRASGLATWNRTIAGVYPSPRDSTSSGYDFIACPISTTWCVTPSIISTTTIPKKINITTLSMSCVDPDDGSSYVDWAITISVAPSIYHPCDRPNRILSPNTFMCILDSSWESQINGATTAQITIHWKPIDSSQTYQALSEVNPLSIQLSSTTPSRNCTLNSLTPPVGTCSACQVCAGEIATCSESTCDSTDSSQSTDAIFPSYIYPYDSFYIQPSCSIYETDTCLHAFDLVLDSKNTCCDVEDIDCMGICHGTAQPGYRTDGSIVCCEIEVDCFGICGGKSYVDACGDCGGTDTGQKCPTYVNITTDSISPNQLLMEYTNDNHTDYSTITIRNDGNTSILVSFELEQKHRNYDPWVVVPVGEFNITAKSSQNFLITSNISRILSKESPTWEVKNILISYVRPNQYGPIPYYVDVLPLVTDCHTIPGDTLCIALPGCIQCLDYGDGIRVLAAEEEEVEEEEKKFYEEDEDTHAGPYSHYYSSRKLYADIMPDIAGIANAKTRGVCRNGWRNRDCTTFVYDAGISHSKWNFFDQYLYLSVALIIFFLIFV